MSPTLPAGASSVYVDMSGSVAVRAAVHTHLADSLKYSCSVGGTHWDDLGGAKGLAGPRPVLFFAPAQGAKRREEWGAEGFDRRLARRLARLRRRRHARRPAMAGGGARSRALMQSNGPTSVLLDGTVPAREGHVLTLATA